MSALEVMAANIRTARKAHGWKVGDLAERIGVHANTAARLEMARSPNGRLLEVVTAAASALDMEPWALFLPNGAAAAKLVELLSLLTPADTEVLLKIAERFADAALYDEDVQ